MSHNLLTQLQTAKNLKYIIRTNYVNWYENRYVLGRNHHFIPHPPQLHTEKPSKKRQIKPERKYYVKSNENEMDYSSSSSSTSSSSSSSSNDNCNEEKTYHVQQQDVE